MGPRRKQSSRTIPWLHAAVCKPIMAYMEQQGISVVRYLERHSLPLHEWNESHGVVPRYSFGRFMTDVARSQGVERLGWESVAYARRSLGSFPYSKSYAPTLYLALKDSLARTQRHCSISFFLVEARDSVLLCRRPYSTSYEHDREMGWFAIAAFLGIIRDYTGEKWKPTRMAIPPKAAAGGLVSEEFPDTRFLPAESTWWFEIPHRYLSLGPLRTDGVGEAHGSSGDIEAPTEANYAQVLGNILRTYLPSGAPTQEFVAELLGTSPRTLKRRLHELNRTYSEVLEESRFALAKELLDSPDQKVIDVAYEAGYKSPSNFTRAFHRFTGVTPQQYRSLRSSSR